MIFMLLKVILTLLAVMCFVFFPTSSKYIQLKTTTDCTDNPKFEEVSKTKTILSYRINDQNKQFSQSQ